MANFLGNLGAAFRGQQQYSDWQDQKEAAKLRIQEEKARLAEIEDLASSRKSQRARDPEVNKGLLDALAEMKRRNDEAMGIAPPPAAPGAPPPAQQVQPPPAPGQPSVPMMHPGQQPQMRQMGPPMSGGLPPPPPQGPPQGQGMPPQGMPPQMPQQRPMGAPGQPMAPPQAPPIPPYQTIGGNPPPQQGPQGIPPPPQQNRAPAPNSMTLADAAAFIKSKGVTDPTTSVQILEKLTPYLNNEAKQEAAQLKAQLAQQDFMLKLQKDIQRDTEASNDRKASVAERDAANRRLERHYLEMEKLQGQRENRLGAAASAGDGTNKLTPAGMAVQEELIRAGKPIPKGKRGEINYQVLNSIGEHEEGGAGSGALTGGQAEYKANASTYGKVQQRTAGIELGVKKIEKDINLLKSTMAQGNAGFSTVLNQPLNYLRAKGSDPKLAAYALAAKNVAVEFERLRSGGMLSAAQLHAGAQEDAKNILNENMSVAETLEKLPIMLSEIQNGREAAQEVEKYYKDELHVAQPASKLPPTALKQLKKGVHTTFGNGQTWMLDDSGSPVEVK